jgi:hypothetical protein
MAKTEEKGRERGGNIQEGIQGAPLPCPVLDNSSDEAIAAQCRCPVPQAQPPNPGSDEAIAAGCLCPVLDNCHGAGSGLRLGGRMSFWIGEGCPIHVPRLAKLPLKSEPHGA